MEQSVRYCAPTKYDKAPYKSVMKVLRDDGCEYYAQTSENLEEPIWERVGLLLEEFLHRKHGLGYHPNRTMTGEMDCYISEVKKLRAMSPEEIDRLKALIAKSVQSSIEAGLI
jgi:hypothetical protein